jgi:hypothetical protein
MKIVPTFKGSITGLCFLIIAGCLDSQEEFRLTHAESGARMPDHAQGVADQHKRVFVANLSGGEEVPAVQTMGTGQATFMLNEDGTALHYRLVVANIKDVTQSHIHCGGSGVNGPVTVFLFGLNAEGLNVNGVLAEGTITPENVIARPDSEACMGGLAGFENLLEKLRSGDAYVNVHTLAYPGGEIRGQIR